jgi:hypothetical protein
MTSQPTYRQRHYENRNEHVECRLPVHSLYSHFRILVLVQLLNHRM